MPDLTDSDQTGGEDEPAYRPEEQVSKPGRAVGPALAVVVRGRRAAPRGVAAAACEVVESSARRDQDSSSGTSKTAAESIKLFFAGRQIRSLAMHTSRIGALRPLRTREERGRSRTRRERSTAVSGQLSSGAPSRNQLGTQQHASYRGADIIETETEAPSSLLLSLPQPARRLARLSGGVADRGASARAS